MLRNLLFAIIILVIPANLWAKERYQQDLEKAFQLREEGKLQEALVQFQALSKAHPKKLGARYGLAGVQALLGNYSEAMTNLKTALRCDKDLSVFIGSRTSPGHFIKLLELPEWSKVEAMVSENLPFEKKALTIQLWRIYIMDQAYSWKLLKGLKELGPNSPKLQSIGKHTHKLNRKNQRKIVRIIAKYGWPKRSEVGEVAGAAFLVIQHASHKLQKKYFSLLEEACQAGEAHWSNYALMYDRIKFNETGRQLYGTQFTEDMKGFRPIEDIEYLNERRLSKGLPPMEDYAAFFGINWKDTLLQMEQKQRKAK